MNIAQRIPSPTRRLRRLTGPALFLALATSAAAEDCKTMLKPSFDWIQQSSSSTEFPVAVTLTAHTVTGSPASGIVEFAFGESVLSGDVLTSQASVHSNHTSATGVQHMPELRYLVKISRTGWVSIQKLVNGKVFLNKPPLQFQGICSKGLVTGMVNSSAYSLSLRTKASVPKL